MFACKLAAVSSWCGLQGLFGTGLEEKTDMDVVFRDYSRYYNLLYRDKDYSGEIDFVLGALARVDNPSRSVLDLGCGTGRHALELATRGVEAIGVDRSEGMVRLGRQSLEQAPSLPAGTPLPELVAGDARTVRLGRNFDAITSLFHVFCYHLTEEDVLAHMVTARAHLRKGGHFLFDFWHGPGVLTDPPTRREKFMEDEVVQIRREAVPTPLPCDNRVDVAYRITVTEKTTGQIRRLDETHCVRYYFFPELRYLARQAGFVPVAEGTWPEFSLPTQATWYAWMLLTA